MFVLIALFIAGAAYDVMLYNNDTAALGKLNSVMRQYDDVLATDPTQPSIDASAKNIKELEKHLADLEKDLTRESEHIFKPLTAEEGFQLREQLRGMVNSWRAEAKKRDIYVPDEMDFGYKSMLRRPPTLRKTRRCQRYGNRFAFWTTSTRNFSIANLKNPQWRY